MKQVYSLLVLTVAVCLSHAASFSGSMPKDAERSVSGRYRRGTSSLTETEIKAVVDQHNALRAAEGASNMELMVRISYQGGQVIWSHSHMVTSYR